MASGEIVDGWALSGNKLQMTKTRVMQFLHRLIRLYLYLSTGKVVSNLHDLFTHIIRTYCTWPCIDLYNSIGQTQHRLSICIHWSHHVSSPLDSNGGLIAHLAQQTSLRNYGISSSRFRGCWSIMGPGLEILFTPNNHILDQWGDFHLKEHVDQFAKTHSAQWLGLEFFLGDLLDFR